METVSQLEKSLNASSAKAVTEFGIIIDCNELQLENASPTMKITEFGLAIASCELQFKHAIADKMDKSVNCNSL